MCDSTYHSSDHIDSVFLGIHSRDDSHLLDYPYRRSIRPADRQEWEGGSLLFRQNHNEKPLKFLDTASS